MQENNLFEFAVIRLVPRVEREEFINVGAILFCKKKNFLKVLYTINEPKINAISADVDLEEFKAHLEAFNEIALGSKESGPIGELETAERFRWLTATRSTILQTSRVHPGLCMNLEEALKKIFKEQVL
ncbi:MAG TPA: DUF3037 domain-containing protein [Sphingobacteriaceae bacterium]|nr:DUF3037 domain-containing protein [Sphingobacteriaceae bacterium]